jgi:hypothetical protein
MKRFSLLSILTCYTEKYVRTPHYDGSYKRWTEIDWVIRFEILLVVTMKIPVFWT